MDDQRADGARTAAPPPPSANGQPGERLAREAESLGALFSGVLEDLQDIVRAEIRLAKTELQEDAAAAGKALGSMALGGVVALFGVVFLLLTAVFVLDIWLPLWVSAGIVTVVLLVAAAILVLGGKKALSAQNLAPEQTIATLKEDQAWVKAQISSVRR